MRERVAELKAASRGVEWLGMDVISKIATSGHRWAMGSPDRRAAQLNACIEVMRDRHRRSAVASRAEPSGAGQALADAGDAEVPEEAAPDLRIRRVVTLLPASGVPDAALR
jgi:hypothetical protein